MLTNIRFLLLIGIGLLKRHAKKILKFFSFLIILLVFSWFFLTKQLVAVYEKLSVPFVRPKIVEGVIGKPLALNPLFTQNDAEVDITSLVFRGLTRVTADGSFEPDLAESFSAENEKEYLFKLKKDIYWHDGKKFTASDVIYTVRTAQDPNLKSRYFDSFKDVKVEKLDDFTIKFILKESFSPFPGVLKLGIIPEHVSLKRFKPIGTGSFRVLSSSLQKVTLTNGRVNLIFKFYPNIQLALTALQLGEIGSLGGLGSEDLKQIKDSPQLKIYTTRLNSRFVAIFFNTKAASLSEKAVRNALVLATSKENIVKELNINKESIVTSPIPKSSWAGNNFEKKPDYNQDLAVSTLEKNGWKLEGNVRKKDGKELAIKITSIDSPDLLKIMALVKEQWGELGIKIDTRVLTGSELREKIIQSREYEVLISTQAIGADPDQYVLWHSTQTELANITNLTSAKVDKALEDGRTINDKEIRRNKYLEFQKLLVDEVPAVFLYWVDYNYVAPSKISGVTLNDLLLPIDRFNSINNWQVKRRLI